MSSNVSRKRRADDSLHLGPAVSSPARAGAFTRRQVRRLQKDWLKRGWRGLAVIVGMGAVLVLITRLLIPAALAPYLIGAIVASTIWWSYTLMMETSGLAAKRSGILGEEWTAAELARLHKDGWRTANHVMLQWRDVDHAALGPGGFFAVETKFRSSWSEEYVDVLARTARDGAQQLGGRLGPKESAEPIVVVWGRAAREIPESFEHDGVVFCRGDGLLDYLRRRPITKDRADVDRAFDRLVQNMQRRDKGEVDEHGPFVRPFSHGLADAWVISVASLTTLVVVMGPARLQPAGWWTVATSMVLSALALMTRRRKAANLRIRYTSVGVLTTATGTGLLMLTSIVLEAAG